MKNNNRVIIIMSIIFVIIVLYLTFLLLQFYASDLRGAINEFTKDADLAMKYAHEAYIYRLKSTFTILGIISIIYIGGLALYLSKAKKKK